MAWIKSHSELKDHPKTIRAARRLGVSVFDIIGRLHALWWWAMGQVPDGLISAYDPEDIAHVMGWEKDPNLLLEALVTCGAKDCPGFLDRMPNGDLMIHDWEEHCGDRFRKRQQGKERLARWREKQRASVDSDVPDVTRYTSVTQRVTGGAEIEREKEINTKTKDTPQSGASGDVSEAGLSNPKVPGTMEATPEKMATSHVGQPLDGETPEKIANMSVGYPPEFEAFWEPYPRKVAKKAAFIAWRNEIKASERQDLISSSRNFARQMLNLEQRPIDKILHPETFLRKERWRDWIKGSPSSGESGLREVNVDEFKRPDGTVDGKALLRAQRGYDDQYQGPDTAVAADSFSAGMG